MADLDNGRPRAADFNPANVPPHATAWRRNGKRLYFNDEARRLLQVGVDERPTR
jgi:hypothetical protein